MRKFVAAAAAVSTLLIATSASAAPADQDSCNKLAFSLAEKAAGKKLAEAQAVKVDELVSKLEGQCADNKLADADATAKEIEAALK